MSEHRKEHVAQQFGQTEMKQWLAERAQCKPDELVNVKMQVDLFGNFYVVGDIDRRQALAAQEAGRTTALTGHAKPIVGVI